jgi:regulator of protease activity HflC (stomatin/prohibitin superfamily)
MDGRLYGAERIARGGSVLRSIPCARDLNRIQSEAYREVEQIRGVADAKATEIYARAYNQSPEAVGFY